MAEPQKTLFEVLLPILSAFLGAIFGFFSSRLSNQIQDKRKVKQDNQKELQRLSETRDLLYHLICRWKSGLEEQLASINSVITNYPPIWNGNELLINRDTIDNYVLNTPGVSADLSTYQIQQLDSKDLYKILVGAKESKERRQLILTEIFIRTYLTETILEAIQTKSKLFWEKISIEYDSIHFAYDKIMDEIQNFYLEVKNGKHPRTVIRERLLDINNSAVNKGRLFNNYFVDVIKPIHLLLKDESIDTIEARVFKPLLFDFALSYNKARSTRELYQLDLDFWNESIVDTITVIDKLIEIEYPNEPKYVIPKVEDI